MKQRQVLAQWVLWCVFLAVCGTAYPATITVTSNADSGSGTLRQAISDAVSGDTIEFDMAQVTSPISLTSDQLTVNKNLTITGPGADSLTVQRSSAGGTAPYRSHLHQQRHCPQRRHSGVG